MPAVSSPEHLSFAACAEAPAGVYNEAFEAPGQPRPAWRRLFEAASQVPVSELAYRSIQAEQLLHENGVTFNVFHEGLQAQRPWQLDLIPFILAAEDWRRLETGLRQRTRLLDLIVRDCHSERSFIRDGSLPPEILFANPGFRRMFVGLHPIGHSIVHSAAELARHPDGTWRVMADRAESPAGAAFALENRIITTRTLPAALHEPPVQRLAPFFIRFQETLRRLAGHLSDNPRIVLLSPGAKYPYYFEDVYLARYLGYTLVEGADLAVRDHRVYLKTLAGLIPVDVILSRAIERGIDPLELGGGEPHGVPGLLRVIREGKVVVVNTPGCGLIESPIFMAFLESLCKRHLGEELLIPSIPTWWCGDPSQWSYVQGRFDELVIKPAFQASGGEEVLPRTLTALERSQLIERIAARPHEYVAQELIARSAVPVFRNEVGVGHVALRAFLVLDGDDYAVMPGGLARFADDPGPMQLSVAAGVGSKDVRVLADAPVAPVTLLTAEDKSVPLRRTSAIFPSRVADDLFWFGTFLDRADFLSRLLRAVIERLTAESASDLPELSRLIRALADQGQVEPGFAIDSLASPLPQIAAVLPRMVANAEDVKGVTAAVSELYRLASLERLWMSTDTYRKVRETAEAFGASATPFWDGLVDLLEAINKLILDTAAVSGLLHDGMVRGPAWRVLDIGRRIERVRNTAALLRTTLSSPEPVDRPILRALLEVIDCRMTYRSRYMDSLRQNAVLDLCITDETCPRSIAAQLVALVEHVDALPGNDPDLLRSDEKRTVMAAVNAVRMISAEQLEERPPQAIVELVSAVEGHLKRLSEVLSRKYLLHSGVPRQINVELQMS